jgi:hypothetical protein
MGIAFRVNAEARQDRASSRRSSKENFGTNCHVFGEDVRMALANPRLMQHRNELDSSAVSPQYITNRT